MPGSVAAQILREHLVSGELRPGAEIAIKIDHTLTQDLLAQLESGKPVLLTNALRGTQLRLRHDLTARQREIVLAGGLLNHACWAMATAAL